MQVYAKNNSLYIEPSVKNFTPQTLADPVARIVEHAKAVKKVTRSAKFTDVSVTVPIAHHIPSRQGIPEVYQVGPMRYSVNENHAQLPYVQWCKLYVSPTQGKQCKELRDKQLTFKIVKDLRAIAMLYAAQACVATNERLSQMWKRTSNSSLYRQAIKRDMSAQVKKHANFDAVIAIANIIFTKTGMVHQDKSHILVSCHTTEPYVTQIFCTPAVATPTPICTALKQKSGWSAFKKKMTFSEILK